MFRVYIVLSLACVSWAQIPGLGFCPDYFPMAHFDMNRFLGKWYEAERYFQFSEVASRCVVTDYAVGPNGKIYISNEVTNRFTGVKRVIAGNMDLTGKKTEGKLVVKYDTSPLPTTSTLTVLDTDYDTYAVIWSCSGLGPVNAQSAWLMTRERIPDANTLQQAYGVLDRFKISRTFFVKTDQAGCAIAASDLNAALGIASTSTNVDQNADLEKSMNGKAQPIGEVFFKNVETESELMHSQNITDKPVVPQNASEEKKVVEDVPLKTADVPTTSEQPSMKNIAERQPIKEDHANDIIDEKKKELVS